MVDRQSHCVENNGYHHIPFDQMNPKRTHLMKIEHFKHNLSILFSSYSVAAAFTFKQNLEWQPTAQIHCPDKKKPKQKSLDLNQLMLKSP